MTVQVEGHGPGEKAVTSDDRIDVEIAVQSAPWIEISWLRVYLGTELVYRGAIDPNAVVHNSGALRYAQTLHIPLRRSAPLVVAVDGEKQLEGVIVRRDLRPFAFINPIWLVKQATAAAAQ